MSMVTFKKSHVEIIELPSVKLVETGLCAY